MQHVQQAARTAEYGHQNAERVGTFHKSAQHAINTVLTYSCDTAVTWDSRDVLFSQGLKQLGVVSDGPVGPPEGLGGAEPLHEGIHGLGHLLVELGNWAVDGLHVCPYLLQQAPALGEQHGPCCEL